jgi:alcohol dehydrogenase, propanol-preferring
VCVALPADGTVALPIFDMVLSGKSVIGSIVGTRNDLADVLPSPPPAARRRSHWTALDDVNEAMADVLSGDVPAPVVFRF